MMWSGLFCLVISLSTALPILRAKLDGAIPTVIKHCEVNKMTKSPIEKKLDEIYETLEKIKDKPKGRYEVIKDLALPFGTLLIAALSIILTHISSEKQREDASYVRQQKYIEFFLNNFSDPSKQAVAFELL
jgi:hypothetical protein